MNSLALIIFALFLLAGGAGVILPFLPGVPLAAVGVLFAAWLGEFQVLGLREILIAALLAGLSLVLDYLTTVLGARLYGASARGVWGALIGSVVGVFFFPPFGFLLGAGVGAIGAELITGRSWQDAVRAGLGTLIGSLGGVAVKLLLILALALMCLPPLIAAL
mgnify:CR=1 FL=1